MIGGNFFSAIGVKLVVGEAAMKRTAVLAIMLSLGAAAFAQRVGPQSGGNVRGFNGGFGSIAFPGGGQRPVSNFNTGYGNVGHPAFGHAPVQSFSITDPSFASRLGRTVNGTGGYGYGGYRGMRGQNYVYVPYAYPVYADPYYSGYAPDPAQAQQPNVTVIYPPQSNPITIINQTPPAEASGQALIPRDGAPGDTAPASGTQTAGSNQDSAPSSYYLIAFKDHSIYSAVAYWVEGDTLHYFTAGNVHNQASMSLVDKELTERLNKERSIDVNLPR